MENTPSNKAILFAQYLQQECRASNDEIELYPPYKVNGAIILNIEQDNYPGASLLLRPLSSIKDEECNKLAELVIGDPFGRYRNMQVTRNVVNEFTYIVVHHKNLTYRFQIDCKLVNFSVLELEDDISSQIDMKPYACVDYLRLRGFALPFHDLSVEQQITYGWIKLKP